MDRFPALATLPRVELCTLPSPVQHLASIREDLWIKRDDLNAPICAGNKARALEFLLGGLAEGDSVVTVGGAGSTHVLSTNAHASRLGVTTHAHRWKHDMNEIAETVAVRIAGLIPGSRVSQNPVPALVKARLDSFLTNQRYIPLGGSSTLGILGHVNAALEVVAQAGRGEMPMPSRVVVPLGSGGTAAGLLTGFAIAEVPVEVVGARVGPGIYINRMKVLSLARRTTRFIERLTGESLPRVEGGRLRVNHDVYGGGYGRPLERASVAAARLLEETGIRVDHTYAGKAWTAALEEAVLPGGPVLFWLTFDASCLTN